MKTKISSFILLTLLIWSCSEKVDPNEANHIFFENTRLDSETINIEGIGDVTEPRILDGENLVFVYKEDKKTDLNARGVLVAKGESFIPPNTIIFEVPSEVENFTLTKNNLPVESNQIALYRGTYDNLSILNYNIQANKIGDETWNVVLSVEIGEGSNIYFNITNEGTYRRGKL